MHRVVCRLIASATIGSTILWSGTPAALGATETILYQFGINHDANPPFYPNNKLFLDTDGSLIGTTSNGGSYEQGAIYRLNPFKSFSVLHAFAGGADGGFPNAGVVIDALGNLRGTAGGGVTTGGVAFKFTRSGTEQILNFSKTRGYSPVGSVTVDAAGNSYGFCHTGGAYGFGTAFEISRGGRYRVLYAFQGGADGTPPSDSGTPTLDAAGNLYGADPSGGGFGGGSIFKITPGGIKTILHAFTTNSGDSYVPSGSVAIDASGTVYGANFSGYGNAGNVFKISAQGAYMPLHTFPVGNTHTDGRQPNGGVVLDVAGNVYGTTQAGGPRNRGVVYKVDAGGVETVLYQFLGEDADGEGPSGVIVDAAGNLFGTAGGGLDGHGIIYEITQ